MLAGPNPFSADVYRLDVSHGTVVFQRISFTEPKLGVSTLTASCCVVIVADARQGGIDHVERLTPKGFIAVPGLGGESREDPQFVNDTTLAFFEAVPRQTSPTAVSYSFHVRTVDLKSRTVQTILDDTTEVGAYALRADGILAYIERSPDGKSGTLLIRGADRQRLATVPGGMANDAVGLRWGGAAGLLAVGDVDHRQTLLLASDGSARGHLAGWTALAWAPDGEDELLMTDGRRIGVWRPSQAEPRILSEVTSGGVYAGAWSAGDPLK